MRNVLQDRTLLKHQFQMEAWECRDEHCRAKVRVPPSSEARRRQDMSSAKDLLDVMRVEAKSANAEIALRSILPGKQGIAIEVDLTPAGREVGRYYTPSEIARIRMETVQQVSQAASQPKTP